MKCRTYYVIEKYKDYNIIAGHSHEFRDIRKNGKIYCTIGSVGLAFNRNSVAEYSILSIKMVPSAYWLLMKFYRVK
nr:hypothetical protein [Spirochaetaceae bacterium]